MTQVSQRYLSPQVEKQIFDTFLDSFTSLGSTEIAQLFLSDLLSTTEQIMLGKRLAIAYMLQKGYTQREIVDVLKVSLTTISKVSTTSRHGKGYRAVVSHMLHKEAIVAFFDKLEEKLDHLLPPKGVNWSEHYRRSAAYRRARRKKF